MWPVRLKARKSLDVDLLKYSNAILLAPPLLIVASIYVRPISSTNALSRNTPAAFYDAHAPDYETVLTPEDFETALEINDYPQHRGGDDGNWDSDSMYNPDKFEGDIANELNASTVEMFIRGAPEEDPEHDIQYNAIRDRRQLWHNGKIPYALSSQYSSYSRSVIASAMQEYGKSTCIEWVPRSANDRDYVYILPERGCYSMVGKTGGRQILSLGNGCIQKGIIIHEMMHAVGFFHEQSRTDRDDHITIMWHNILPGMTGQFEKYTTALVQTMGVDYDYASIMHYGPTAFTRNGLPTIVPRRRGSVIGQRTGFSKLDSYKINTLYDCPSSGAGQPAVTQPPPVAVATTTIAASVNPVPVNPLIPPAPQPILPLIPYLPQPPQQTTTTPAPVGFTTAASGYGSGSGSTQLYTTSLRPDIVGIIGGPESASFCRNAQNTRPDCDQLAQQGWCSRNPGWMRDHCPISCGLCAPTTSSPPSPPSGTSASCEDLRVDCPELAKKRYCITAQTFARTYCARSCGFCFIPPATEFPDHKGLGISVTKATPITPKGLPTIATKLPIWPQPVNTRYWPETARPTSNTEQPRKRLCKDRKHFCGTWKKAGFCHGLFISYMKKNCPEACGWC